MNKSLFATAALWMAASCGFAQSYTSYFTGNSNNVNTNPTGGICLMGGASENDNAMRWFLQRAAGGDVLVLRASGSNGYNDYLYSELGVSVNSVETIVCHNASAAFDPYVQQRIAQAEAVWFAGGDQWNYVSFWRDSPVDSLVNLAIQNRNVVVGGTSAGMAILGGYYFSAQNGTVTSAEALTNPYNTRVTVDSTSFIHTPFLNNVITDTHFDSPNRKGRFTVFMARIFNDYGVEAKGIACDEYTAVCIDPAGGAAVYGNFPASDDNAYFIQTNCEITERNPETCTSGMPLTWNRNGTALRVYKVKGTQNGANKFRLSDWKTGVGGVWEQWYVQGGALSESAANPINCQITSTDDEVQQDLQPRIHPNPGQGEVVIQTSFPIKRVQVLNLTAQVVHTFEGNDAEYLYLNLESLPKGLYLFSIRTSKGDFVRKWTKI